MGYSKKKHGTFKFSEEGKSKVKFENGKFYVYGHKEDSKPIIMKKEQMNKLCKNLVKFQKEMKSLDPKHEKNGDLNEVVIDEYKRFQTKMTLNCYDKKFFIWLKLYFDPDFKDEKPKKKRYNDDDVSDDDDDKSYSKKKRKNESDDEDENEKSKKRRRDDDDDSDNKKKIKSRKFEPCKGGVILNDVDVSELEDFVDDMLK